MLKCTLPLYYPSYVRTATGKYRKGRRTHHISYTHKHGSTFKNLRPFTDASDLRSLRAVLPSSTYGLYREMRVPTRSLFVPCLCTVPILVKELPYVSCETFF